MSRLKLLGSCAYYFRIFWGRGQKRASRSLQKSVTRVKRAISVTKPGDEEDPTVSRYKELDEEAGEGEGSDEVDSSGDYTRPKVSSWCDQ